MCVYFSMLWEDMGNWNCFSLPIFTFPVKRQRKDQTSLRLCNSINSAGLKNLEKMIKMTITITIILTAIMVLAFFFRKEAPKSPHSAGKAECQRCKVSVIRFVKSITVTFLVLISTKFINQNLLKATD